MTMRETDWNLKENYMLVRNFIIFESKCMTHALNLLPYNFLQKIVNILIFLKFNMAFYITNFTANLII
jgi:hypothetical protein